MRKFLVATTCILFCGPAFAESLGERLGIDALLGISPTTRDFVSEAATRNLFEIRSSELAQQLGDPATRAFAGRMIAADDKIRAELEKLAAAQKIELTIPGETTNAQHAKMDRLDRLRGAKFDKVYRGYQYSADERAVSLFQRYARGGANPAFRQWARQTAPELKQREQTERQLERLAAK